MQHSHLNFSILPKLPRDDCLGCWDKSKFAIYRLCVSMSCVYKSEITRGTYVQLHDFMAVRLVSDTHFISFLLVHCTYTPSGMYSIFPLRTRRRTCRAGFHSDRRPTLTFGRHVQPRLFLPLTRRMCRGTQVLFPLIVWKLPSSLPCFTQKPGGENT